MDNTSNKQRDHHIPPQKLGSKMDVIERLSLKDEATAVACFHIVKQRLLSVNEWGRFAGQELATFKLTNAFGNAVERLAEVGDYLRIDIPGPGTTLGEGYDWVKIEEIAEETEAGAELVSLRVRPANNPLSGSSETAHFLAEQASSTFQVKRVGRHIFAEEHGRNEQPNTYTTSVVDNLRNMFVGWAATLGFSYPQWKALVKGLLQFDDKNLD